MLRLRAIAGASAGMPVLVDASARLRVCICATFCFLLMPAAFCFAADYAAFCFAAAAAAGVAGAAATISWRWSGW
jgi:hypothetical protein